MEYLKKYLDNTMFIKWASSGDPYMEQWWREYIRMHPQEEGDILRARNIVVKMRAKDIGLYDADKEKLYCLIMQDIEKRERRVILKHRFSSFIKYAAVAVIFFSAGSLLFHRRAVVNPLLVGYEAPADADDNLARLIRPDGKQVGLPGKEPMVEITPEGVVVVNRDTLERSIPIAQAGNDISFNRLIVPYGQTSYLTLPDGTGIWLNAGSSLMFPEKFAGANREVLLAGEAFFEVAHDPARPFIVRTKDVSIKVMGTKFNISAYASDDVVETVLTEGKVSILKNNSSIFDKAVELSPMKIFVFNCKTGKSTVAAVDPENYILWKDGILKFEGLELNRVAKKLERFFNVRLVFDDSMTGIIRISGKLKLDESIDEVFTRVAKAASVKITRINDNVYEITY